VLVGPFLEALRWEYTDGTLEQSPHTPQHGQRISRSYRTDDMDWEPLADKQRDAQTFFTLIFSLCSYRQLSVLYNLVHVQLQQIKISELFFSWLIACPCAI
jgi:hypothetical protein